ncbi:MAG: histidine triad family protein [Acidimicrobiaceae bacterium]|jgi:histidine triad (HIT) family protein|nr:histidine triad family protein [Acidimicrobiaceae bacterium]MDQ1369463.1 histidine triad family protein [Acidimicrobiaceae bacterium]MDQ1441308.1 histidine triad family protein [Acidimicrobiaceae bacterium]
MGAEENCLFCRIIRGEVPSDRVLSTDNTYAFRDIEPAAPVHVLVVPRRHIAHAGAVGPDDAPLLAELLGTARQVAEQEGVAESGYRLVFNVGEDARNSVAHLHLHVLGGRQLGWPPG